MSDQPPQPPVIRGGTLKEDERFAGRQESDWPRAIGTFLGVCGLVILGSSSTLGMYAFGPDSMLTLGPIIFSGVCLVGWFALSFRQLTERMSQRRAQFLGLTAGFTAALVAFIASGHYLLAQDPVSWDLSARGVESLSEQTVNVLQRLDTRVRVTAFYKKTDPASGVFERYAARFRRESDKVEFRLFDPEIDLEQAEAYKVAKDSPPIVVEANYDQPGGERRETRFGLDMRATHHEEPFTSAIMTVTLAERKRILVTTGHGEADPLDEGADGLKAIAGDLRQEGYDVIRVNLFETQRIPEETALVLVPGPTQRFLPPEAKALQEWLAQGGRAAILLENGNYEHGLDGLLGAYGVQANKDLVLDVSDFGQVYGPTKILASNYADHPITQKFQRSTSLFHEARSLSLNPLPEGSGVGALPLVKSTEQTWGETDFESIARGDAAWDAGEARGPVTLAVAVERTLAEDPSDAAQIEAAPRVRMVVVGDASFATNDLRGQGANRNLMLNMVGWLADAEGGIAIRPRTRGTNQIVLTPNQRDGIAFFVLYLMPVALLSLGLGIWLVRRQR